MTATVGSRREDSVLHIELSNPGRRNALTWSMYEELRRLFEEVNDESEVRVVVIRGADGSFAAGTDITQFTEFRTAEQGIAYEREMGKILAAQLAIRVPVVGVVEGPAIGGGLAIATCCDVLVANESACFGVPIARTLGNIIAPAVMQRLRDRLGPGRTMAMLLTSRLVSAQDAHSAGLVHQLVPDNELESTAESTIQRIADGAPLTLAAVKELDRRLSALQAADFAEDVLGNCYGSADFAEGVAAFLDRRKPVWKGL